MSVSNTSTSYCASFTKKTLARVVEKKLKVPFLLVHRKRETQVHSENLYNLLQSYDGLLQKLNINSYEDFKKINFVGDKARIVCEGLGLSVEDF